MASYCLPLARCPPSSRADSPLRLPLPPALPSLPVMSSAARRQLYCCLVCFIRVFCLVSGKRSQECMKLSVGDVSVVLRAAFLSWIWVACFAPMKVKVVCFRWDFYAYPFFRTQADVLLSFFAFLPLLPYLQVLPFLPLSGAVFNPALLWEHGRCRLTQTKAGKGTQKPFIRCHIPRPVCLPLPSEQAFKAQVVVLLTVTHPAAAHTGYFGWNSRSLQEAPPSPTHPSITFTGFWTFLTYN